MLKNIKIKNFYSIGRTQELCFGVSQKDVLDDSARNVNGKNYVNLVSCIVGHNASGKTSVLRALTYIIWLINNSYTQFKSEDRTALERHRLLLSEPASLEIEFFNNGTLYQYNISLDEEKILSEKLSQKNAKRFIRVFEYKRDGDDWDFKSTKIKINKSDSERFKKRKNVSLLSSLIDTGYLTEITFFKDSVSNVTSMGLRPRAGVFNTFKIFETLHTDGKLRSKVLSHIKEIDLGISDFSFSEITLRNSQNPEEERTEQLLELVHESSNKKFELPYFEESDGTRQSISILSEILPALNLGKVVILDEIEDGLHPYVVKKIVSLFENKKTNPKGAQLFFSTHQHLLLNDRTKTQIFLTERETENFETEVYRLDEVEGVRNDENYFHKYIAGTYGGIPRIDWL